MKIIFIFVLEIVLVILSNKTEIDIFGFFFVFILAAFVLDVIWLLLNFIVSRKVFLQREVPDKLVEGGELKLKLILKNGNILPILGIKIVDYLSCVDKDKEKVVVFDLVKSKNSYKKEYSCFCNWRGKYLIGPLKVLHSSFLGLFWVEENHELRKYIYVYPKIFQIEKVPPLTKGIMPWFGLETIPASGDEDEFFGLREYKKGDPLKRIHWFSTARKGRLIVKEFQRCNFYQACLLFLLNKKEDRGIGKEKVSEYIVKIAASLSNYFIENEICVGVLSHAGRVYSFLPNKGQDYLDEMFKFYAEAEAESRINMQEFVEEYYNLIPSYSTLFVIITENNINTLVEILSLRAKNVSVVALVVISATFESPGLGADESAKIKEEIVSKLASLNIKALFFERGESFQKEFL